MLRMSGSPHRHAVFEALFVTFLWSTSWILMKVGLREVPALTFAGLRYATAWLVLLPVAWNVRGEVRALSRRDWGWLAALGLVFYALTQGGVFLSLAHLDAVTLSLVLGFTPVLVAAAGVFTLKERPAGAQWVGLALAAGGAVLCFLPMTTRGSAVGVTLAGLTLCANAVASLLGRAVNRRHTASPIVVTTISMGVGAVLLLSAGLASEGLPKLSPMGWGIVVWLAVVNTAVAFTLWNRALRVLSAAESSAINNTMMIQIAVLAWLFLGETLDALKIVGLLVVAAGTTLIQFRSAKPPRRTAEPGPSART